MRERILEIVFAALRELQQEGSIAADASLTRDMRLFGPKSALDSLGLVNLIASVEEKITASFGKNLVLADEQAMSQTRSPFRTVDAFTDHIEKLLGPAASA